MSLFVAIVWEPSVWIAAVASLPFLVGIMTWLATTKLTLTSDAVRYRSLFSKTDVPLSSICGVRFEDGFIPWSYKPFFRVIISVRDGRGKMDITLNAGLFDLPKLGRWIKAVNANVC
jgi:hypothetical protein